MTRKLEAMLPGGPLCIINLPRKKQRNSKKAFPNFTALQIGAKKETYQTNDGRGKLLLKDELSKGYIATHSCP